LATLSQSIAGTGAAIEKAGADLGARGKALESRLADLRSSREELERLEAGATEDVEDAAYDVDTIAAIRKDADTIASFAVKAAESADNKNAWSGARILLKAHWEGFGVPAQECLATVPAVVAALEKIGKIHVNVFPKDADGQFVIPPILIEPVRNFVEFFDDRIVLSVVSGEAPRKGPKVSLTPGIALTAARLSARHVVDDAASGSGGPAGSRAARSTRRPHRLRLPYAVAPRR